MAERWVEVSEPLCLPAFPPKPSTGLMGGGCPLYLKRRYSPFKSASRLLGSEPVLQVESVPRFHVETSLLSFWFQNLYLHLEFSNS